MSLGQQIRLANIAKSRGLPGIIGLLEILHIMSESTELTTICSTGYQPVVAQLEIERLRQACAFINDRAHQALTRDNVAKVVHMSSSGFSRFSKAHTGKTFPDFVADIRGAVLASVWLVLIYRSRKSLSNAALRSSVQSIAPSSFIAMPRYHMDFL